MTESILSFFLYFLFPTPEVAPAPPQLHFVYFSERAIASCLPYELHEGNIKVQLSEELEELLECPPELPVIAPNERFLVYVDGFWTSVKTYDLITKGTQEIMTFPEDSLGGISFMGWSPDETKLAIVTVDWNHDQGSTLTKLHILSFEPDGTFISSTNYDAKITMVCGSANCSPSSDDLVWIDNHTIQYRTWDEAPYDLEGPEAFKLLNL